MRQVLFSQVSVCSHFGGGGAVPHLADEGCTIQLMGVGCTRLTDEGGTPPSSSLGYLHWDWMAVFPCQDWMGYSPNQDWVGYPPVLPPSGDRAADRAVAFTQEDFLVRLLDCNFFSKDKKIVFEPRIYWLA